jgi:hypothetical protein
MRVRKGRNSVDTALSVFIGIGLSAAVGFRIFVPFLIMSIAALSGNLDLAPGFDWVGTYYALIAFLVATVVEVLAYYIPWVDNVLDTVATPAAVVAGIVATAAVVTDMSPLLKWSLALIAGGGAAATVQATTVAVRGASSLTTGGIGNPVVATGELGGSTITSLLAIIVPVLTFILLIVTGVFVWRGLRGVRRRRRKSTPGDGAATAGP